MSEKDKNDPIIRTALWLGYNKKCFYCKELINFNNFQIDHVIPQNMDMKEAKELYNLKDDFIKDSFHNLVPSCFSCNNQKRAKEFDKGTVLYYLNIIKANVPNIVEIEKKYRKMNAESLFSSGVEIGLEKSNIGCLIKVLEQHTLTTLQEKVLKESLEKMTPISTLSFEENEKIQKFIDSINSLLNELSILNDFCNIIPNKYQNKTIGVIIYIEATNSLSYSLFTLADDDDSNIKELEKESWHTLVSQGIVESKNIDMKKSLVENPKKYAEDFVFNYFSDLLSQNLIYKTKNLYLANEYIFDFLTENNISLGILIKDMYNIEEIEFSLKIYLPIWINEVIKEWDIDKIAKMISRNGYIKIETLSNLMKENDKINDQIIKRIKNKDFEKIESIQVDFENFPLQIVNHFLEILKENHISNIGRTYSLPDYTREKFIETRIIYNAYSDDDIIDNFNFMYSNLESVYNELVNESLPQFSEKLIPFVNCSKFLIQLLKSAQLPRISPFKIQEYQLNSEEVKDFEIIIRNFRDGLIQLDFEMNVNTDGIKYHASKGYSTIEEELFLILPMFIKIRRILKENILLLLEEDYTDFLKIFIEN